jgi:hypothetical protein
MPSIKPAFGKEREQLALQFLEKVEAEHSSHNLPAARDPINAPRVIRDAINCWTPGEMLYPTGVAGSTYPNTCQGVKISMLLMID